MACAGSSRSTPPHEEQQAAATLSRPMLAVLLTAPRYSSPWRAPGTAGHEVAPAAQPAGRGKRSASRIRLGLVAAGPRTADGACRSDPGQVGASTACGRVGDGNVETSRRRAAVIEQDAGPERSAQADVSESGLRGPVPRAAPCGRRRNLARETTPRRATPTATPEPRRGLAARRAVKSAGADDDQARGRAGRRRTRRTGRRSTPGAVNLEAQDILPTRDHVHLAAQAGIKKRRKDPHQPNELEGDGLTGRYMDLIGVGERPARALGQDDDALHRRRGRRCASPGRAWT